MFSPKSFFTADQVKKIEVAIKAAEENTSGEIRVHIDGQCKGGDPVLCAQNSFHKMGMDKTALANGVLFYLAVKDKQFAVIGDKGIHQQVSDSFWNLLKDIMQQQFKLGNFTEGLCDAIGKAGVELKKYFPYSSDDKNELSNEVNFGSK